MELAKRRVHLAAVTPTSGDLFRSKIARNLNDGINAFLKAMHFHELYLNDRNRQGFEKAIIVGSEEIG